MQIQVKSEKDYNVKLNVNTANGNRIEYKLPENGELQISFNSVSAVELMFDESEKSFLGKFFEAIIDTICNFVYFYMTYETLNFPNPIGNAGNYIKTTIYNVHSNSSFCCEMKIANVVYKNIKLPNALEVNIGIVEEVRGGYKYKYEIDKDAYYKEYSLWLKRSMLLLVPVILGCFAAGIGGILLNNYLSIVCLLIALVLGYLTVDFFKKSKIKAEKQLENLCSWVERHSSK